MGSVHLNSMDNRRIKAEKSGRKFYSAQEINDPNNTDPAVIAYRKKLEKQGGLQWGEKNSPVNRMTTMFMGAYLKPIQKQIKEQMQEPEKLRTGRYFGGFY